MSLMVNIRGPFTDNYVFRCSSKVIFFLKTLQQGQTSPHAPDYRLINRCVPNQCTLKVKSHSSSG